MIPADTLVNFVRAYTDGNHDMCKKIIGMMVANEKSKGSSLGNRLSFFKDKLDKKNVMCEIHSSDLYHIINPERRLDSLVLSDDVRMFCDDLILEHKSSEILLDNDLRPRNKILFHGKSGNGNT